MRIDVSKLCYTEIERAFASAPFKVLGIACASGKTILECEA